MRSLAHTFHHHICIVSVFALYQNYASVCVKLNLTRLKGNIGNYEQMPMQRQNESEKNVEEKKEEGQREKEHTEKRSRHTSKTRQSMIALLSFPLAQLQ